MERSGDGKSGRGRGMSEGIVDEQNSHERKRDWLAGLKSGTHAGRNFSR